MKRALIFVRIESLLLSALLAVLSLAASNSRAGTSLSMDIIQFGSPADNSVSYGIFLWPQHHRRARHLLRGLFAQHQRLRRRRQRLIVQRPVFGF